MGSLSQASTMASSPAFLVLVLSCVFLSLVETTPQPIFDIARIFSPIAAGGRKRHKNRYNDCCYDDYDDDYRRRRRRSALERGPTLDDLDDRGGGYGKRRKCKKKHRRRWFLWGELVWIWKKIMP